MEKITCPYCLESYAKNKRKEQEQKRIIKLLEGANDETIKKAQKRLAEDCGFGQRDNDIDIKVDSIRDGWLHGPQQLPSGHAEA